MRIYEEVFITGFCRSFLLGSGVFVASCDDDNNPVDNPPIDGETAYVVAATTGEASYLVVAILWMKEQCRLKGMEPK